MSRRQICEVVFRVRHGFWCEHPHWTPWRMANLGANKYRSCHGCGRWHWV